MKPEMLQMLMMVMAGAGLPHVVQSIEKMAKVFGMGPSTGKQAAQQPGGPQGASPGMPMPGGPAQSQIDPSRIAMLMQMLRSQGGGMGA